MRKVEQQLEQQWKQLNEYQQAAVLDDSKACLVNACVGSGKTTVLVAKILYLHKVQRIPYREMVVLTFTNKAADEIRERLLVQEPDLDPEEMALFGTFHSVAMKLLQTQLPVENLGWQKSFEILLPEEETELVLQIAREKKLTVKYKNRLKKRMEQEYASFRQGQTETIYADELFLVFSELEQEKKRRNQMSYTDLLQNATALLGQAPGFVRPTWVIVDEVQDSDQRQIDFLSSLMGEETRLFAVGDPNQLIYGWRGSMETIFYALKRQFQAKELSLPINYRSNGAILEAAKRFQQYTAPLNGYRDFGSKIIVRNHYDPFAEAQYLAVRIRELIESGVEASEIAIFYRLQEQEEILKKVFQREGDPGVQLLTLHASKGLEFSHVFLIGVNQGLIPLAGTGESGQEEERRLFFVGMTRAKNYLELSYYTNPGKPRVSGGPGWFLKMLPPHVTEWSDTKSQAERKENLQELRKEVQKLQREKEEKKIAAMQPRVKHRKYGVGVVVSEDEMTIEVEFENYGKKQFMKLFNEVETI